MLASVHPNKITVSPDSDKQRFVVTYNCGALAEYTEDYFDTVLVSISDDTSSIMFEFIVVCDPPRLRSFDINFLVLFGLAVLC